MFRDRGIHAQLRQRLSTTPVVILQGARQVGKSTLVQALGRSIGATYRTLDDREAERAAREDPEAFVASSPDACLIIDEAQRVPDLVVAIKSAVDRVRQPGRYLLTGSADLLWAADSTETLTGRAGSLELWPYSQGEIQHRADNFIAGFFAGEVPRRESQLRRDDYIALAIRGGFPLAHDDGPHDPLIWLDDYLVRVQRDVAERGRRRRIEDIPDLMRVLAGRQAQELNVAGLAKDLGLKADSIRRYLQVLEHHYLVRTIPSFASDPLRSGIKRPKVLITDSGLGASLLGLSPDGAVADLTGHAIGQLLEGFVVNEVLRQLSWADPTKRYRISHYRESSGPEIDLIVENAAGDVLGIEVKSQTTPPASAPTGLQTLRDKLGDRFVAGIVLYTGGETIPLGDRVHALPIDALWAGGTQLAFEEPNMTSSGPALVGDAQVFWSYSHADDQRDAGRIRRLADAVKQEYEFLTGGEALELFIDEDLQWGDRWRERVDAALHRTTFFVAALSPTYLRRPECQRELEMFLDISDRGDDLRLLLPLKYGPLPDNPTDPVAARLLGRAREHQWVDLADLRFHEENSEPWRRMVNQLAQRLVDAADEPEDPSVPTPPTQAKDEPDLADLMSQVENLEPAVAELSEAFEDVGDLLGQAFDAPDGLPPKRMAALIRTEGRRVREEIEVPLVRLEAARDQADEAITGMDGLIRMTAEFPDARTEMAEMGSDFLHLAGQMEGIDEVRGMLRTIGTMSRDLRDPLRRIESVFALMVSLRERLKEWAALTE